MTKLIEWLRAGYAVFLFPLSLSATGIFFVVASLFVGVDRVRRIDGAEVGYLLAPSWTISPIILFPILFVATVLLVRQVEEALSGAAKAAMFWDSKSKRWFETSQAPIARWRSFLRTALTFAAFLTLIGVAYSAREAYLESYLPLQEGWEESKLAEEDVDHDWGIAALTNDRVSKSWNQLFTVAAFVLLQGGMVAITALLLVTVLAVAALILSFCQGRIRLGPGLGQKDLRRGFELFATVGTMVLVASFILLFALWLTQLQNEYLRTTHEAPANVYDRLLEPFTKMVAASDNGQRLKIATEYLKPAAPDNRSSMFAIYGGFVAVFLFGLSIAGGLFYYAAREAKQLGAHLVSSRDAGELAKRYGLSEQEVVDRLNTMVVWPYRYFEFNLLGAIALVLATSIFWAELAVLVYVILLLAAIKKVTSRILGAGDLDA